MPRLPRFQRVVKVAPIRLTERDQKIIRLIHRHRFLRSHQIVALIGGSAQNLSRRLQWLFHQGYLERPRAQLQYYERNGSQTITHGLGNKSGSLLKLSPASWGEKNRGIGRVYLAHALLVSDVMVALELACRRHGIRLLHEDELKLPVEAPLRWRVKIRDGTKLGVIPDRVFALEYADQHGSTQRVYYFLEADRGTMPVVRQKLSQTSFYRKLLAYEATWTNKVHQRHLVIPRFRVLTVTTSAARVKSLLDACSRLQRGHGLFLFADESVLQRDLLAAVWQCGKAAAMSALVDLPNLA
ncbi:MAG: replication-relaxation family protein, partial [Verrucomicrobiae bacterium]